MRPINTMSPDTGLTVIVSNLSARTRYGHAMPRRLLLLFLIFAALHPAAAQDLPALKTEDGMDAGFARSALLRGEILPLGRILDILRGEFKGEIIEIQLELEDGVLTYEFDLISLDGRVYEVEIEARTGKIVDIENGEGDED